MTQGNGTEREMGSTMVRINLTMVETKISKTKVLENSVASVGGLSNPSKMPWFSYSIPAEFCKTGSKLAKLENTVCSDCYACKGRYLFGAVKNAMNRRFEKLENLEQWTEDFSKLLNELASVEKNPEKLYFRWHDSGDIQSVEHLAKIVQIAWDCPTIRFWIPTREYGFVTQYIEKFGELFPPNLTIRLSTHMVDSQNPPKIGGLPTSTVHTKPERMPLGTIQCEAYTREGKCADCRVCWDSSVQNVSYPKH